MPVITAPSFIPATGSQDLVAFNLQNAGPRATVEQFVQFNQQFGEGDVPAGSRLVATIGGTAITTQVDVTQRWPDGSVKAALITLDQPPIAAGATLQGMLSLGGPAPGAALPKNAAIGAGYDLKVNLDLATYGRITIDGAAELAKAIAANKAEVIRQGENATEVRFDVKVAGSLQLTLDVTTFADGSTATQVFFRNDLAMQSVGGTITYNSISITEGGQSKFLFGNLTQYQYQTWSQTVFSDASAQATLNVQHDVDYLQQIGVVPGYDLGRPLNTTEILSTGANWTNVLGTNGVTQYMPTTGGRTDIGPTTEPNAVWLMTQDAGAAKYALAQAQAAGTIPWHLYDAANGNYLSVEDYPQMWIDSRGTQKPTQLPGSAGGWTTDTAHTPDMSYISYLLTGDQYHLEMLNAQASFVIAATWNGPRKNALGLVVNDAEQVRAQAWSIRAIQEAADANPDGSYEKAYFTQIADNNWAALRGQINSLTSQQGEIHGIVPGVYRENGIAPWQQDFFASSVALAALQGNDDARAILKWEANFLSGRFLSTDMDPHNGYNYTLNVYNSQGAYQKTWAGVTQSLKSAGNYTTNDGGGGYYAELALMSNANIITVFNGGDDATDHAVAADAMKAYGWLLTSGSPDLRTDLQYQIVPRMADGSQISATEQFVTRSSTTGATHQFAGDNSLIYDVGVGGARLVGTSGADILIDRSTAGNDTLAGGAGDDYLIGGRGANFINSGSGNDYAEGGAGADLFRVNSVGRGDLEIGDFALGVDLLRLKGTTAKSRTDILDSAINDVSGSAVLTVADDRTVTLIGINVEQLSASLLFG